MKRSEINAIIRDADKFLRSRQFFLPPFAHWTPDDWTSGRGEVDEIVERGLGWDVTDFGRGDYAATGLCMFTLRNGDPRNLERCRGKVYAEKVLLVDAGQVTLFHFHWVKMEDIINRGGGDLLVQLHNSTDNGDLARSEVAVMSEGYRQAGR